MLIMKAKGTLLIFIIKLIVNKFIQKIFMFYLKNFKTSTKLRKMNKLYRMNKLEANQSIKAQAFWVLLKNKGYSKFKKKLLKTENSLFTMKTN